MSKKMFCTEQQRQELKRLYSGREEFFDNMVIIDDEKFKEEATWREILANDLLETMDDEVKLIGGKVPYSQLTSDTERIAALVNIIVQYRWRRLGYDYSRMCDRACFECEGHGGCELQRQSEQINKLESENETLKHERDFAMANFGRVQCGMKPLQAHEVV